MKRKTSRTKKRQAESEIVLFDEVPGAECGTQCGMQDGSDGNDTTTPTSPYFDTPNSPTIDLLQKSISNSKNLTLLADRQKDISHSSSRLLELFQAADNSSIKIKQTTEDYTTEITFRFSDIEKGLPQPAKKLFRFIATKINQQAFSNRTLRRDYVEFPLQELVDEELYGSIDSARKGFKIGMKSLMTILVEGSRTEGRGNRKTNYKWVLGHMFRKAAIDNNTCRVQLETENNWNFIISQYEIMPNYSYKLSNRGYDLTEAIFYLARINCREIARTGQFNISFKVIQQRLALPESTPNPGRDIKKPIKDAIGELNAREKTSRDFWIETFCDEALAPHDWIKTGFITVHFGSNYLEKYRDISARKCLQIDAEL